LLVHSPLIGYDKTGIWNNVILINTLFKHISKIKFTLQTEDSYPKSSEGYSFLRKYLTNLHLNRKEFAKECMFQALFSMYEMCRLVNATNALERSVALGEYRVLKSD
jgi:hypothetical protein